MYIVIITYISHIFKQYRAILGEELPYTYVRVSRDYDNCKINGMWIYNYISTLCVISTINYLLALYDHL